MSPLPEEIKMCVLCKNTQAKYAYASGQVYSCDCPICKKYNINKNFILDHSNKDIKDAHILSALSRNICEDDIFLPLQIDKDCYKEIINSSVYHGISIPRKAKQIKDKILLYFKSKSNYLMDTSEIDPYLDYTIGFCKNPDEFIHYLQYLKNKDVGYLQENKGSLPGNKTRFQLTYKGWEYVESLEQINSDSSLCFIAMKIDKKDEKLEYFFENGLKPAIRGAGYNPHRIDEAIRKDPDFDLKIDDRIMSDIKRSRFMVADFTHQSECVYYEAGYAKGLGLNVIWCCRDDELKNLKFDTRNIGHIGWNEQNLENFINEMKYAIINGIGPGPEKPL